MELSEAIDLLAPCKLDAKQPAVWMDLGCGSGLFTYALATCLVPQSRIYAVDKQPRFVQRKPAPQAGIEFVRADFTREELPVAAVSGILMANSLHYVKDKEAFICKMKTYLQEEGMWVIIEYDTKRSNPWVPYPVDFERLQQLFGRENYQQVVKRSERRSIYNTANMYCATVNP